MDDDTLLAIVAVCLKKKQIEKRKRKKRLWIKDCHRIRNEFTYQNLLDELKLTSRNDFRHFLTSDVSIYEELLRLVGPLIKKKDTMMREAIPVGLRLSATLRFLATGDPFESLSNSTAVSSGSMSKLVLETCEAIISRLKDYIKLPETQEGWEMVSNDFYEKWNFPNCLGVANGKHIAIIKPTGTQTLYYNYKKFFSVVLLAVINANYEFLQADVDISGHTSGVDDFFNTSLGNVVYGNSCDVMPNSNILPGSERELPYVFVGPDAFQLNEQFMTPYSVSGLTEDQKIYNYRLNRVQQISENTLGALCFQFGVLQKPINLSPEKVRSIVLACCYLYNFLRKKTDHLYGGIFDEEDLEGGVLMEGSWRKVSELTSLQSQIPESGFFEAEQVKENFMEFFNNEGTVSWQYGTT